MLLFLLRSFVTLKIAGPPQPAVPAEIQIVDLLEVFTLAVLLCHAESVFAEVFSLFIHILNPKNQAEQSPLDMLLYDPDF